MKDKKKFNWYLLVAVALLLGILIGYFATNAIVTGNALNAIKTTINPIDKTEMDTMNKYFDSVYGTGNVQLIGTTNTGNPVIRVTDDQLCKQAITCTCSSSGTCRTYHTHLGGDPNIIDCYCGGTCSSCGTHYNYPLPK